MTLFRDKKVDFHSYQIKQERNYKIVITNIHHTVEEKVNNIYNIKQKNNKDMYNIISSLFTKITIEPTRTKCEIVQCERCQKHGHSKAHCYRQPRFVKCGKNDLTKLCHKDK